MIDLKKQNVPTLRLMLDEAMEQGEVQQIDAISQEVMLREGIVIHKNMPEHFAETISRLAGSISKEGQAEKELEQKGIMNRTEFKMASKVSISSKGKRRKTFLILAAALVLLLGLGTAAYASGVLFASHPVHKSTSRIFPFSQEEPRYKAACEYSKYMDQTPVTTYYDPYEHPIYMDEGKVAELCEKYGLNYATEKTPLRSMEEIRAQMKRLGLERILPEEVLGEIEHSLAEQNKKNGHEEPLDYAVNAADYVLDDNTLCLAWGIYGGPAVGELIVMPKGTFPYMGREYENSVFPLKKVEDAYTYTSKNGIEFYCIPAVSIFPALDGYVAFAGTEDRTIAISIRGNEDDSLYKEEKKLAKRYDKKAKQELGLSGLDELTLKAGAWRDKAMEQDLKALNAAEQAFELNGDDSGVKALQRKYSDCSQEVWNMYEEYEKEYREVQRAGICKIDQESFEGFLDRMGEF